MPPFSDEEREILDKLAAPFPPDVVQWRPGQTTKDKKKAQALAYIDARDVQNRLDEVLGFGWDIDHYGIGDDHVCCRVTITLPSGKRVTRSDGCWVGNVEVHPTKDGKVESKEEDRADREAKWALSDAFKRAAVKFGVGKYLYDMPSPWVEIDQYSKLEEREKEKLKGIAAKPFNEWNRERAARAKGQGGTPPAPRTPPERSGAPQGERPPRQAPPREEPRAQEPSGRAPREDAPFIDKLVFQTKELKDETEFKDFVARTKDTFAEGSEERKRYASAVKDAAKRLGIKPKAPPPGREQG